MAQWSYQFFFLKENISKQSKTKRQGCDNKTFVFLISAYLNEFFVSLMLEAAPVSFSTA